MYFCISIFILVFSDLFSERRTWYHWWSKAKEIKERHQLLKSILRLELSNLFTFSIKCDLITPRYKCPLVLSKPRTSLLIWLINVWLLCLCIYFEGPLFLSGWLPDNREKTRVCRAMTKYLVLVPWSTTMFFHKMLFGNCRQRPYSLLDGSWSKLVYTLEPKKWAKSL